MDIILNLESLAPPITGVGCYALELAKGLRTCGEIERLVCFGPRGWMTFDEPRETPAPGSGRRSMVAAARRLVRTLPGAYPARAALRNMLFSLGARDLRHAVYHEPNYVLKPFAGPCVVTVHDLSHLHYPHYHPRERVRFLETNLPKSLGRADHIITVSEFVRGELIGLLGLAASRVSAIPLGAGPRFRPRDEAETGAVLSRHGLRHGGYLLAVGTLEPRKNLAALLRAYGRLPPTVLQHFPLVVAGAMGWRASDLGRTLATLERKGLLRNLGYVAEADLPYLYSGAGAFAFPSIYEGFGLPVVEALASGVPVLTSLRSALPEVAGRAALLVDPEDDEALHLGLLRLLEDETFRGEAGVRGPQRSAQFTWQRCVARTVAVYRRLLS